MDRERFIPVAKADLVDRLSHRLVRPPDREGFELFCRMLESLIHHDFHRLMEALKADNRPFNPDSDTRLVQKLSPQAMAAHEERLLATFKAVLNQATYR